MFKIQTQLSSRILVVTSEGDIFVYFLFVKSLASNVIWPGKKNYKWETLLTIQVGFVGLAQLIF